MIGDDRMTSSAPASPIRTGKPPMLRQAATAPSAVLGRIEHRDEPSVVDGRQDVDGDERIRVRPRPASAPGRPAQAREILDAHAQPRETGGLFDRAGGDPDPVRTPARAHVRRGRRVRPRGVPQQLPLDRPSSVIAVSFAADAPASTSLPRATGPRSICCSVDSSQVVQSSPSTSSDATGVNASPSSAGASSTTRESTRRKRTWTLTAADARRLEHALGLHRPRLGSRRIR